MHIAYDSQIFRMQQNGGISKYFVKLIEALQIIKKDIKITVNSGITKNEHLLNSEIVFNGISYHSFIRYLIANRFYNFIDNYNLAIEKNTMSNSKIDIIHQTYNGYELFVPENKKIVITIHDLIHEKYPNDFLDTEDVLIRKKQSIESADHIICISKHTQLDLIKYYKVDVSKTSVVHHGVDEFTPQYNRLIKEDYILFVGKRGGYKNFNNFLLAYSYTQFKSQVKLVCFGSANFNEEELELIEKLDLLDRVIYITGSDMDLNNLYQYAVFFIYPSIYEGFGLPVLEAMANNCPVICSDSSSLPEVSNNCALSVNCENIHELNNAMNKLFYDDELKQNLVELGKQNVKQFSWKTTAIKTLEVYNKIINRNNEY